MRCITLFLLALAVRAACAQSASANDDWLASPPATQFRERVVQLALIYGESSGIDPRGYKILTRELTAPQAGCADVEVVTLAGERVVRRETVRACRRH